MSEVTALSETGRIRGGLEAMAIIALREGRPGDALTHADRWLAAASRYGPLKRQVYHLLQAEALRELGRIGEARAAIREARDVVLRVAASIDDPELRESYLNQVVNNARTLELAREWLRDESPTV